MKKKKQLGDQHFCFMFPFQTVFFGLRVFLTTALISRSTQRLECFPGCRAVKGPHMKFVCLCLKSCSKISEVPETFLFSKRKNLPQCGFYSKKENTCITFLIPHQIKRLPVAGVSGGGGSCPGDWAHKLRGVLGGECGTRARSAAMGCLILSWSSSFRHYPTQLTAVVHSICPTIE